MVNHIVMWKFKEGVSDLDKRQMKEQLEALKNMIPAVVDINAGIDVLRQDRSWDIVLTSKFKSMEDLQSYAQHPEHLKVVAFVKTLVCAAAAVDYEE